MTDILFGQSYYLRFDPKLYAAMQPYPPLGTLYAASAMRERGYDVALFDAMLAESTQAWADALDRHAPRLAVIFEDNFNYLSKMSLLRMRDAAFTMIDMARARGCTIVCCGSDETDHADLYLERGADVVLIGEGDAALPDVITHYAPRDGRESPALEAIAGIAYRAQDGSIMRTSARPVIADLDSLPFPAWDLVDHAAYQSIWRAQHGYTSMNLVTTRGCPFHCNWCAKPIWGQRYNVRSPQNVVDEMAWLQSTFSPDHIWFMDDIMGIRDRWIEEFADLLDARGLRIPFKSLNRADLLLRGRSIPALARAGAQIVWIGAESGSQKILDAMEKGTTVEQIYASARGLHAHGVKVGFFLQFGYPGETRADIELTLQMVRDLMPDDIGISVSYPLPGTRFYETVKHELGARENWIDSGDMAMLYRGTFRTEFYRQLHTVLHKEYRSLKTAQHLRAALRQPEILRPADVRSTAAMLYHRATLPAARHKLDTLARLPHDPIATLPNVTLS
ncbi:MAG: radical SAM protein [Chloroflexota bacterium]|nr:radical SAM protein [Chloroflexota bacterium]